MDRKLLQFLAVAEIGNVSKAAEALHISQPTLSVNVKRLEEHYGVPLLARSSRGIVLTAFGQVLYEHARGMDRLSKHAAAEIQDLKDSNRPRLRLACGFVWWEHFIRDAIADIRQTSPQAGIHVDISSSLEGIRALLAGDISFFVGTKVRRISTGISLAFETLFETTDLVFARADHPLAARQIQMSDLKPFPRLDVAPFVNSHLGIAEEDHDSLKSLWEGFGKAQLSCNSMTVGVSMLQDHDSWIYYTKQAERFLEAHGIHRLKVGDLPAVQTQIGIYALPDKTLTPLHEALLSRIRTRASGQG